MGTDEFGARLSREVGGAYERHGRLVRRLTPADYLSLLALLLAWVAATLFLTGEVNWAILAMLGAYVFDKLDGYVARSLGVSSPFGRAVDSYIDVFVYLVTGALLFHYALAPNAAVSAVVGFLVVALGGLRLVRHTDEGFVGASVSHYRGTTVVHTNVVVLVNYFLLELVPAWNGWLAAVTVAAACPFMISDYRSPKTSVAHALVAVVGAVAVGLTLGLEFGYL